MMTENMTMTEKMRDEMFKYALEVINEDSFSENNWTKLHEKDRFYNWYHGYTKIQSPDYGSTFGREKIFIPTWATSGVVTTQHYGEQFKPDLVERKLDYGVNVYPPESVCDNENVTLHFKLEKVSMTGLARLSKDTVWMSKLGDLDADQTTVYTNFTPPGNKDGFRYMRLWRDVCSDDVETQKRDVMPGVRFTWWYSGAKVTPENKFKDEEFTKQFVR